MVLSALESYVRDYEVESMAAVGAQVDPRQKQVRMSSARSCGISGKRTLRSQKSTLLECCSDVDLASTIDMDQQIVPITNDSIPGDLAQGPAIRSLSLRSNLGAAVAVSPKGPRQACTRPKHGTDTDHERNKAEGLVADQRITAATQC